MIAALRNVQRVEMHRVSHFMYRAKGDPCGDFVECGVLVAFDPTEGPPSVAEAKCRRVLALIDDTSLGVKQAYTNSLRG